jgi:putative alpha-1,2-mannosidase
MVNVGPVQPYHGWDWCSGYHESGDSIVGFSHTHLSGTGCSDLGDITLMPIYGYARTAGPRADFISDIASRYRHEHEVTEPGYYSVLLDKWGIRAEMTATERTAIHRFTFPKGNRYANVFPDPVGDKRIKSFPSCQASMEASCIGFSASIFKFSRACDM